MENNKQTADAAWLKARGATIISGPELNPLRSTRVELDPLSDDEGLDRFYAVNNWVTLVRGGGGGGDGGGC